MLENCPQRERLASGAASRRVRIGKPLSAVLVILILVRTGHALAGEQFAIAIAPAKQDLNGKSSVREPLPLTGPMFDLPKTYQATDLPAGDLMATGNFRPRGHSLREIEAPLGAPEDMPMLQGTTMWERLADFRSHGRVRLLTLWEAGDNSVSLQAGKKGEPSLQWTSRSMNRGGATRGLFDRLMPASSRSSHPSARSTTEPSARTARAADAALNGPNR